MVILQCTCAVYTIFLDEESEKFMKQTKEMKTMKEEIEQYKIDAGIHNEKLSQRQLLLHTIV